MEWSALRDLLAVAETGSLSAAARRLGSSQPTMGRRIEQLEKQLKTLLFNRTSKGLILTPVGEQILGYAKNMAENANAIERIASGADQSLQGVVRMTMTDQMGNYWLPTKLSEFRQRYPGLRLEIVVENRTLDLFKREADIAVRFSRPQQLDLVVRKSIDYHYGFYASKSYLENHDRPESLKDLKNHSFISYDETIFSNAALKRLENLIGEQNIVQRYTSNSGVINALTQNLGLSVVGCYFADQDERLERLMPTQFDYSFNAWVVTHADLFKSARIKAVFDFLVEKLAEDATDFAGVSSH
ncbi:MAG: LysR family transcriptional regulator [Gammaproteobacteria bacterium]|nr:LysR family transcriptional regulator [Gammaproteobacteria bacterium]